MNKFISVKEFANIINEKTNYVYRLLEKKEYKKFKKKESGQVLVNIELKDIIEAEKTIQQEINFNEAETKPKEEKKINYDNDYINYLKAEIITLKEELKQKENIIIELNNKIIDLVSKSQEITEKALETTKQAQILQLAEATKHKKGIFKKLFLNKGEN